MTRSDRRVQEEAAAWVEWASERAPAPERAAAFDLWMAADPAHRQAFAELLALWRSDVLAEAAGAVQARRAARRTAPPGRLWAFALPGLAAAAALVLVLVLAPVRQNTVLETERGPGGAFTLADGSRVLMSGDARLQVRQGLLFRDVRLERGEAYFDVRRDPRRPFHVRAAEADVRVLGTAFDVNRLSSGRVELSVYRGSVLFRADGGARAQLGRGESAALDQGRIVPGRAPAGAEPDWATGWFDVGDASLGRLLEEISRFADRPVVTDQPEVAARRVSGRFHVGDPQAALSTLELAYGLSVTQEPGRLLVRAAK